MRPPVLLTRRVPASVLALLEQHVQVDVHSGPERISPEDLVDRVRDKQGLICLLTDTVDRAVMDAAPHLRVIANIAVGYDNVDVAYARARGIAVTNTPDVLTEATAEFTWGLILTLTRRIAEGERVVRSGQWQGWALDYMLGMELRGKQLGVVGLGRIGLAVAVRAPAFGMRVAYATSDAVPPYRGQLPLPPMEGMSLDHLLATSHVVSLHVPLTPATRHLIDGTALARMKRTAFLVNTSRGPVVDEAALAWALRERLIAGAALDVYEHEPMVHPDLLSLENVVLAPHLGSATTQTRTAMAELAARNAIEVIEGRTPLTPVP
ncbi:MAG: 2-hydroxyacid dehydrogenase [Bacteroidales bacterium]